MKLNEKSLQGSGSQSSNVDDLYVVPQLQEWLMKKVGHSWKSLDQFKYIP